MFYIFEPSVHKKTCRRTEQLTWNRVFPFRSIFVEYVISVWQTYESVTESGTTRFDNEG